jgi:hypothetical protein
LAPVFVVALTAAERSLLRRLVAREGTDTARTLDELLERAPSALDAQAWLDDAFDPETTKICALCATARAVSEFGRDAHEPDGLNRRCRDCRSERERSVRAR